MMGGSVSQPYYGIPSQHAPSPMQASGSIYGSPYQNPNYNYNPNQGAYQAAYQPQQQQQAYYQPGPTAYQQ